MLQWMSANTVHMCYDVLVTELVGFLGACMYEVDVIFNE